MMPDERDQLREDEIKAVVKETLISIGVDITDPIAYQADARFIRSLRQAHERVGVKIIGTLIALVITGGLSLIVMGTVSFFKQKIGS